LKAASNNGYFCKDLPEKNFNWHTTELKMTATNLS